MLLGTPTLLLMAGSQTAGIPLIYYLLAVAALLLLYSRSREKHLLGLAGLMAGMAAWTKNEGQLFLLALCAALVIMTLMETLGVSVPDQDLFRRDGFAKTGTGLRRKPLGSLLHSLWPFALGLLLPLATLLAFKLTLAPTSDLFAGQTISSYLAKLADPSRYQTILVMLGKDLWDLGRWRFPILPVLFAAGILLFNGVRRDDRWGLGVILLSSGVTLLGYLAIYLITPHPLQWHLDNSLDRLLFHFYPVMLMVLFTVSRSIQEALAGIIREKRVESRE